MSGNRETILLKTPVSDSNMQAAANSLKEGGLVVMPTETVYGLAANAMDETAVRSIFLAKGRPADNPLIVHIADKGQLEFVSSSVSPIAEVLFDRFSPGPLTIVLPKHPSIPSLVTAGLDTVAVRIPSHPVALELLKLAGVPAAAPSANRSGRPSPTTFQMAVKEMERRADYIIDGGPCAIGLESTVVRIDHDALIILRPGAITEEMIVQALPPLMARKVIHPGQNESERPVSPGMKYTHYKPNAEVYLSEQISVEDILKRFPDKRIGIMTLRLADGHDTTLKVFHFDTVEQYAQSLYDTMVIMDNMSIEIIIAEAVPDKGIGKALMNRLYKACGGKSL